MRIGLIYVSVASLADVLHLPPEIDVVAVHVDPQRDSLVLKVVGDGLPAACQRPKDSSATITEVWPVYHRDSDGRIELVELG